MALARIFHESVSRDRVTRDPPQGGGTERSEREKDARATEQSQELESEAYLNSTSQGSSFEDAREDENIRGRSSRFMHYPG